MPAGRLLTTVEEEHMIGHTQKQDRRAKRWKLRTAILSLGTLNTRTKISYHENPRSQAESAD